MESCTQRAKKVRIRKFLVIIHFDEDDDDDNDDDDDDDNDDFVKK